MPRPAYRNRLLVKKRVKTPGGRVSLHVSKRRHAPRVCGSCGAVLNGLPRGNAEGSMPASARRVERAYGGSLCHVCAKKALKKKELKRFGYV